MSIFDIEAGKRLAVAGMELAKETADNEFDGWSGSCWMLFKFWLLKKPRYFEFMIEDFRKYVYDMDLIEKPKTDRAFGFISKRALKEGLIEFVGTSRVKNKKAHATPASVWRKK